MRVVCVSFDANPDRGGRDAIAGQESDHFAGGVKAAAQLARVEATADLVRQHYGPGGWWYQCDWRGQKGEFPRPEQVIETWGQWERAAPPAVNGKPPGKGRHSEAWQKLAEGPTMIDLRLERERKAEEERRRQYGIK